MAGAEARADVGADNLAAKADKNRVDDILTLKLYSGGVGDADLVDELAVTVTDSHKLAAQDHIKAEAADEDGEEVEQLVEGGDPVYLTVTVDRGKPATKDKTNG